MDEIEKLDAKEKKILLELTECYNFSKSEDLGSRDRATYAKKFTMLWNKLSNTQQNKFSFQLME